MSPHRNPASGAAPAPAVRRRTEEHRLRTRLPSPGRPAAPGNADYLVMNGGPASVAVFRALSSRSGEFKAPVPLGGMTHSRCPVSR